MNAIPSFNRRNAELVGAVFGLLGASLAVHSNESVWWSIGASFVAGAFGNLLAYSSKDAGLKPRVGIRAGIVAAVVAGATTVGLLTLKIGAGAAGKIIPALLAIPPGIFFGLLGSLVVALICNPLPQGADRKPIVRKPGPTLVLIAVLLLSAVGYFAPFIAAKFPEKKSAANEPIALPERPTPTPAPAQSAPPFEAPPPPPPPWRYSTPAGFADARPSQVRVAREVSLGRFEHPLRATSINDARFAFVRSSREIVLLDLNEPETTTIFRTPESAERFAFSQDWKRVFCVSGSGEKYVVSPRGAVALPLPTLLPDGTFTWSEEKRIAFGSVALDLDSLQLVPSNPESKPERVRHANIRLRQTGRITAVRDGAVFGDRFVFLRDEMRDFATVAPYRGENPQLAADGTKLLFARDGELIVQYFETGESRETTLAATMPGAPPPELTEALAARSVVAVLCPAIINPLNDKPVAADISRVKALLGLLSWTETSAVFWVKEDYGILPGETDVVAALGRIENGRVVLLPQFASWWTTIRDIKKADAPGRITPPSPKEPPKEQPLPPLPQTQFPIPQQLANQVRNFLHEHHAKSSRGDIDGLTADYAERVDHLRGGIVPREQIRAEEIKSHQPGSVLTEAIQGDIRLTRPAENEVRANYTMRFEQRLATGSWAAGFSELDLTMELTPTGPRITRQRARNFDVKKGP